MGSLQRVLLCLVLPTLVLTCGVGRETLADLQPEEVAVICIGSSKPSTELAEYYARRRGIPEDQICRLPIQPSVNLSRDAWDNTVKPFIRKWLLDRHLETQVRCLVTVYDVPLRIGRADPARYRGIETYLRAERQQRVPAVEELLHDVASLGGGDGKLPEPALEPTTELKLISRKMSDVFRAARGRIAARKGEESSSSDADAFVKAIGRAGGLRDSIRFWSAERVDDPARELEIANQLERAKGRYQGLIEGRRLLESLPESAERAEQLLTLIEAADGLLGSIAWIDEQLALIQKNETQSSFDSELSLLFWPRYPLLRWTPNLLHYQYDGSPRRKTRFTLMVSRIEAPTLERCKGLIDDALEAEKSGLQGRVYIDARGIKAPETPQRGSYAEYDRSLREWAALWQALTDQQVVLDNKKELFAEGTCPEAALYCGWYSLAKYVDAFDFSTGAVAYHLASSEATTLRNADSEVWCKRLLEDGAAATMGPVFEPYLVAFPLPHEFFVALGSGKFTLVECYYRTKPFNSWAMTLVGDPLYSPYREKPVIDGATVPPEFHRVLGMPH